MTKLGLFDRNMLFYPKRLTIFYMSIYAQSEFRIKIITTDFNSGQIEVKLQEVDRIVIQSIETGLWI